jgi:PAS domain S-box-containing protein
LTLLQACENVFGVTGGESAASSALVQSTLLGELLENAKIGVVAIESGRYVAANEYACELTGYERAELIGRSVVELNPFAALPHELLDVADRQWAAVVTIRRKDGVEVDVVYRAVETMLSGLPLRLSLFSLA